MYVNTNMKTIKRLIFYLLRTQVHHTQGPLQFAYQAKMSVEVAPTHTHTSGDYREEHNTWDLKAVHLWSAFEAPRLCCQRDGARNRGAWWRIGGGRELNQLKLNTPETKEMVADLHWLSPHQQPLSIERGQGGGGGRVRIPGTGLETKYGCSLKVGTKPALISEKIGTFNICRKLWSMSYQCGHWCTFPCCNVLARWRATRGTQHLWADW